ncbi:MAG: isoprenylcysteine carboxylmethyltransferase family protein [Magnetococcales bacterium]|nr:isoprenylcysteine carboxylmethyltransferase family protein [Magnetococcales bacterium]
MRMIHFIFGLVAYLAFNAVFVYFAGFLAHVYVPKSIDAPLVGGRVAEAFWIDGGLLLLFAVHHSVAPREFFKKWLLQHIPAHLERSVYVLLSSLLLALVMGLWQPIPLELWRVESVPGRWITHGLFMIGVVMSLVASFHIDHYDLFGVWQVHCHLLQRAYAPPPFDEKGLYKVVRHPIMLGTLIALWATPLMTVGHFLLAVFLTTYVFIGMFFEERDLLATLGEPYAAYRRRVPMIFPFVHWPR